LEEGKRIHCEYAIVVQASEWSVERDSRVALWFRLISDGQSPRHVLVAAPAEDVTREAQFSRLIWREHDASHFTRLDLGGEFEIREAESMDPSDEVSSNSTGTPLFTVISLGVKSNFFAVILMTFTSSAPGAEYVVNARTPRPVVMASTSIIILFITSFSSFSSASVLRHLVLRAR